MKTTMKTKSSAPKTEKNHTGSKGEESHNQEGWEQLEVCTDNGVLQPSMGQPDFQRSC